VVFPCTDKAVKHRFGISQMVVAPSLGIDTATTSFKVLTGQLAVGREESPCRQ